jgi:hypothetical protein
MSKDLLELTKMKKLNPNTQDEIIKKEKRIKDKIT